MHAGRGGATNPCSSQGVCLSSDGSCDCGNSGFWGPTCSNACPEQGGNVCSGHGACQQNDGGCRCENGWAGNVCADECPGGEDNVCSGHGVCSSAGKCYCETGYFGTSCSSECPRGSNALPCSGHGACSASGNCACDQFWSGQACGSSECPYNCYGHGTCDADSVCQCDDGYEGTYCSTRGIPSSQLSIVGFQRTKWIVADSIGTLFINVTRHRNVHQVSTVQWKTVDISATAGEDFNEGKGILRFDPDNDVQTIQIDVIARSSAAGSETFNVELYSPSNLTNVDAKAAMATVVGLEQSER